MASAIVKQLAGLPPSPMHLKELIKSVRSCKTHTDERTVVLTELSKIRTYINDKRFKKYLYRNVIKLLYIHMLGYSIDTGIMECIQLISTSTNYFYKRIGYFGLTQLLNEYNDILMLITNCIKIDLKSNNTNIISLALSTLGSIGSVEMCTELLPDIKYLFNYTDNIYLQKKSFLVAIRIIHKNNSLCELIHDSIVSIYTNLTNSSLLTATQLVIEIISIDSSYILPRYEHTILNYVVKQIRLLLNNTTTEYDINGINNPFLLIKLIKLLSLLQYTNTNNMDLLHEIIVEIGIKIDVTTQINIAVLTELIQLIICTHHNESSIMLAITLCSKILNLKNNNYKYIALNDLFQLITLSTHTIHEITSKYESIILDSLNNEIDLQIRNKLCDILLILSNNNNAKVYIERLFALLDDDAYIKSIQYNTILSIQHRKQVTNVIYQISQKFTDLMSTILHCIKLSFNQSAILHGTYVNNMIDIITHADDNVHVFSMCYLLHHIHTNQYTIKSMKHELIQLSAWLIGEYAEYITQSNTSTLVQSQYTQYRLGEFDSSVLSSNTVLTLYKKILAQQSINITIDTRLYILTMFIKLSTRFSPSCITPIIDTLQQYTRHYNNELQSRAIEYIQLLQQSSTQLRNEALSQMPLFTHRSIDTTDEDGNDTESYTEHDNATEENLDSMDNKSLSIHTNQQIDLLDLFNTDLTNESITPIQQNNNIPTQNTILSSSSNQSNGIHISPNKQTANNNHIDLLNDNFDSLDMSTPNKQTNYPSKIIYDKNGLIIKFQYIEQSDNNLVIHTLFSNTTDHEFIDFDLQVAVLKYIQLQLFSADSSVIQSQSIDSVTQKFILNKSITQKKFIIKCKISYTHKQQQIVDMFQYSEF